VAESILAVGLVPPAALAAVVRQLRAEHPGARIASLATGRGEDDAVPCTRADEVIDWQRRGARGLLADVRRQGFDRVVLVHGPDQYATSGYWKAATLVLLSGCRAKTFREFGRPRESGALGGVVGGAAKAAIQILEEAFVLAIGVLLFTPLVGATALADLTEFLARGRSGRRASLPQ
jgi:hypothetical protein